MSCDVFYGPPHPRVCVYTYGLFLVWGRRGGWEGTYVLVDQHDRDVFPLLGELVEGPLDRARFRLLVYDEVVLLAVGRVGDVLDA